MGEGLPQRTALVTGGGRGFGRAIALALASNGYSVAVTARTTEEIGETVAAAATTAGRVIAAPGDVTKRDDVFEAVKRTEEELGPIHLLVHCAGVLRSAGPIWLADHEDWWSEHEVHVHGALHLIQAVVPGMIERRSGCVILVSSNAGSRILPNASGYALSKRTMNAMAEYLAVEARDFGVNAFAIHPGGLISRLTSEYMDSPVARLNAPNVANNMLAYRERRPDEDSILGKCADLCLKLSTGHYSALSGRFLTPDDDLDALVGQAAEP